MNLFEIPHTHYICTAEQSQWLDQQTIEDFGISGYTLMEVAGSKSAEGILENQEAGDHGVILCGKGNNGGDALVVARYLVQHNIESTLVFISGVEDLSPDAEKNYQLLREMNNHEPHTNLINLITSWNPEQLPKSCDFIIDGMLGTGLDSNLRGDYNKAVSWANQQSATTYAIDIPTGLHADTGKIMGAAIDADQTFTFGAYKQGFFLNDGPKKVGTSRYCDLPFPNFLKQDFNTAIIRESWVDRNFPIRHKPARHKYENGVLYIIAGSEGLTGAAIMAAKSAWAEGLGAVILICPRGLLPIFETSLTQLITRPVGKEGDYFFKTQHLGEIIRIVNEKSGKVIYGPGIGRDQATVDLTHAFLEKYQGDMLIDADGLWALAQNDWEAKDTQNLLLTPHPGELSNFINFNTHDDAERLSEVRSFTQNRGVHVLSKGYPVILGTPDGSCYMTDYDTRRFSRAGFGDVLAGKIGAFWTICDRCDQASWHALLNGKKKLEQIDIISQKTKRPEPLDLI